MRAWAAIWIRGRQYRVRVGACVLLGAAWLGVGCGSSSSPGSKGSAGASTAGVSGAAVGSGESSAGAGGAGATAGAAGSAAAAGAPTVAMACEAFAATRCTHFHDCYGWLFSERYASVADCEAATEQTCPIQFAAPGMNVTVAQLNVCTQATIAQTCDEWIEVTPPVCAPPGAEAEGVGCELDGQCASGYCNTGAYPSYCGKCAPRLGTGQPCDPQAFPCALGLRCTYSCPGAWCALTDRAWLCEVPKAEHEPCAFASECRGVLSCVAGACARPATMGQACDESVDDCSHDTICRASQPPDTGATCLKTSFGGPGAVCNSSIAQFCAGGSVCVNAAGTTQVDQGMCVATGLPGQACVVGLCAQPARCVNDACVVPPDAATCQ